MKILTVVGARPQFIKAATVSRAIGRMDNGLREVLVHTGQHFDDNMSNIFFDELDIPRPGYNLGISHPTHGGMTGRMLEQLDDLMGREKPDWVLVYGDTNSTLAGALAAAKLHIPVAHVEAGLRSFNRRMPEEINRVLTDHASDLLFAPTRTAMTNLEREGISQAGCRLVGDVMYDAALYYGNMADSESAIMDTLVVAPGAYLLSTVHRAENTDDPVRLERIFEALFELSDLTVVLPLHPRTKAALVKLDILTEVTRTLRVTPPLGYLDMVQLERNARVILTDSGGVQKEAFFHGVPCVTLREETEWVELVELGWNRLVPGVGRNDIVAAVDAATHQTGIPASPYGDGTAADKIVAALMRSTQGVIS